MTVLQYTLPDLFAAFPCSRNVSEHYEECKDECKAWTESFHPFDEEGMKGFSLANFNLIRLGCDLISLLYVLDEYTDMMKSSFEVEKVRGVILGAFKNPHKGNISANEPPFGAMACDFWTRASSYVSPGALCLEHFIHNFDTYMAAVVREADDRLKRRYHSFEDYLSIRHDSSACLPCFSLCEFGLELPEEIVHYPRMAALREQGTTLIAISNVSRGLELHNSVELVMVERNLDVQGAINWLEQYTNGVSASFLDNVANMPSWGEDVDRRVKIYTDGIAQWVRGNDDWTFESGRYFGSKGLEVQKSRIMKLHLAARSVGYIKN
ncbi:terpenoid synthase [Gymnopilus junonius]|uniref:Terpenoid synthase n=1 Tax=Gymnopilus junonius TaxID=109634 RepID=A0A9P5NL01_GYMJU|nr:terpenoid synthase [Gymnopilus junonius]